jgi:hypothetical protein
MGKFEDIYEKRKNLLNDTKAKAASAAPAAVISKLNHVTLPPKEVAKESTPKVCIHCAAHSPIATFS